MSQSYVVDLIFKFYPLSLCITTQMEIVNNSALDVAIFKNSCRPTHVLEFFQYAGYLLTVGRVCPWCCHCQELLQTHTCSRIYPICGLSINFWQIKYLSCIVFMWQTQYFCFLIIMLKLTRVIIFMAKNNAHNWCWRKHYD